MSKGFVPLSLSAQPQPSAPAAADAKAPPAPPASKLFRTITNSGAPAQPAAAAAGEPKITLEREGNRIVRIRIQCCCGHVIELACNY